MSLTKNKLNLEKSYAKKIIFTSKISQGHVEMLLSFVLFVSFILFLFVFLNPFEKEKSPDYMFDNVKTAIMKNISADVISLSVFPNETNGCYNLSINITNSYGNIHREVKENSRKYTLYFADFLAPNNPNEKESCPAVNYTIGSYKKENYILYERAEQLNQSYSSGYSSLKKYLGITSEFSFEISDKNDNKILYTPRIIPDRVEVNAAEIPINIINSQAQISEAILKIKTWE